MYIPAGPPTPSGCGDRAILRWVSENVGNFPVWGPPGRKLSSILHGFSISGSGYFRPGGPQTEKFPKTHLKIALSPQPDEVGGPAGT